jgi:hypothetical protein
VTSSAYRKSAPKNDVDFDPIMRVASEHRGPRERCPNCGQTRLYKYSAFSLTWEGNRIIQGPSMPVGCMGGTWWQRLFGACKRRDLHLHQKCMGCGSSWMCAPIEPGVW